MQLRWRHGDVLAGAMAAVASWLPFVRATAIGWVPLAQTTMPPTHLASEQLYTDEKATMPSFYVQSSQLTPPVLATILPNPSVQPSCGCHALYLSGWTKPEASPPPPSWPVTLVFWVETALQNSDGNTVNWTLNARGLQNSLRFSRRNLWFALTAQWPFGF